MLRVIYGQSIHACLVASPFWLHWPGLSSPAGTSSSSNLVTSGLAALVRGWLLLAQQVCWGRTQLDSCDLRQWADGSPDLQQHCGHKSKQTHHQLHGALHRLHGVQPPPLT